MKKMLTAGTAALMALTLAACSSSNSASASSTAAASTAAASASASAAATVGEYTIYNATNDSVTGLYLYPTDATDKGTNLAGEKGLSNAHATYATYDAGDKASSTKLTLEFTTKGGYTGTFTTLSIETAPITLIAEDAKTGATAIKFGANPATYTVKNSTGEEVKSLYLYPTGSSDKGENRVGEAAKADGQTVITLDAVPAGLISADGKLGTFTIEFTTASGYTGKFTTLSYETAPIYLIAADAKTGATEISFKDPSAK
jgi:uncharacterized protein (DUF736 family)